MRFNCNPDINLFHRQWYNAADISQGVDYWAKYLESTYDKNHALPLGVAHGVITFSSICCYLAIYKIKMPFVCIDTHNIQNDKTPCQAKIVLGEPFVPIDSKLDVDCTDYFLHGLAMGKHKGQAIIEFDFSPDHLIHSYTSGSTGPKKHVVTTAYHEGLAVQTAINEYFDATDVCLFSHEMTHRGVHTTAILPSLFCAKKVMFVNAQEWPRAVHEASHCQWFPIMREYFRLTANIKKITVGGSKLDGETIQYLLSQAPESTIYDIYGLTECLPPLAIRRITVNDCPEEFTICRPDLQFDSSSQLTISDSSRKIQTGDSIEFVDQTKFRFIGRVKKLVRVNGKLYNQSDLQVLLSKTFPIHKFSLNIDQEKLVLQVDENTDSYITWCEKNHVEKYSVIQVARVSTSGGIKTVNG